MIDDNYKSVLAEKTAKTARRKRGNEAILMWSVPGAVICLVVYYLMLSGPYWFNPLVMNIMGNSLLHGIVLGGVLAIAWFFAVNGKIRAARAAHGAHLHAAEAVRQAETQRKIEAMKAQAISDMQQ